MAWNKESKASRRARVAKQLRDKHGKWIEMGGGVKWYKNGAWHNGTASAFKGNNVEVTMEDGSKQLVNHREIEPIRAKGSLGEKPAKPTGSVQAKKGAGKAAPEKLSIKDNDPGKRLTTNADELEEGDEVYLVGQSTHSGKYGIKDGDAAAFEERGFTLPLGKDGEPVRARVVDSSGDSVVVEDSNGKRHEIDKKDNVLADDPEVDAAIQNRDDNGDVPEDVDDFDVKSVDPKELGIPKEAIAAYNKGVKASKTMDLEKSEKSFEARNGEEFSDDFTVGYLDGQHIEDGARDKFQGLYHKYAGMKERGEKPAESKAEIPEEAPKAEVPEKSKGNDLPLDGLDLTDDEKKSINEAETGEEALKRLTDSDAGQYLPIARSNKNKEFVDAYRKAIKDITAKHDTAKDDEAPQEEAKKSEGTPMEAIEKSATNLAEDIADIKSQKLEKEPEEVALNEATYDVKNDAGEEFLLTPKRGEEDDTFELDVIDSKGNVVDTLPLEDQKPQDFAKAIKNSIESKSTSKDSEEPSEAPETPAEKPEDAPEADKAEEDSSESESDPEDNGDDSDLGKALKDAGFSDDDIKKIENAKDETQAEKEFFQSPSGKKASDKQIADKKSSPEYTKARKAFEDFKNEKFDTGKAGSDEKVKQNQEERERDEKNASPEARAERAKNTVERGKERDAERAAKNTDEAKLAELDRKIEVGKKMADDAEAKGNEPLAKRINENIDNLKKQREKLAPTDEAPAEPESDASNAPTAGEPFDVPEGGAAILSNKKLERKTADRMKEGDQFFGQKNEKGDFAPVKASQLRMQQGAEPYTLKSVDNSSKESKWVAVDSQGNEEEFTWGVGQRKSHIITDSEKNRELMGLTPKSDKSDDKEEDKPEESQDSIESEEMEETPVPEEEPETEADPESKVDDEVSDEKDPEEEKLFEDAEAEIDQQLETEEGSPGTADVNVKSTIEEALQDIEDNVEDEDWDQLKERTWPVVGAEDDLYIGVGRQSTEDDKFLGLYDSEDNELETYDMKGLVNDIDERERTERGRDDSDGGELDRGDGSADGGDSGDDENGDRDRVTQESQSLIDEVKDDDGEAEGAIRQLDKEGYTLAFERNPDSDRQQYVLRDKDGNTIVRFGRKNEDTLADKVNNWRDAHKTLAKAFKNDKDSDERNVTLTREMSRAAGIGTSFEDENNRYTKISPIAWDWRDKNNNSRTLLHDNLEREFGKELKLGHHADNFRKADEIDAMSDDELREKVSEFADKIHALIEQDGKRGDYENLGRRQTDQDQIRMQMDRYDAYAIHDEASEYSRRLWDRTKGDLGSAIDTGEFNPSMSEAFTHNDGSIPKATWTGLRNEYVGLDHRTLLHNYELRNSDKPSRGAAAWGNKMDKWARSGTLAEDSNLYRSALASPDAATEFKAGNVVTDKGLLSVASDQETAEVYLHNREPRTAGKIPVIMEIQARKGEKMTHVEHADELVIPRNAKLFISSAEEDENGVLRVTARLNPSDAEIAEWTKGASSAGPDVPTEAPETPEAELPADVPSTPVGDAPSDTPDTLPSEGMEFAKGQVVEHAKHGRGTIVRVEGNGEYARVNFDKYDDPKKTFGINLKKLTQTGETATPPNGPETDTKVKFPDSSEAKVGAWTVGERVNHGKHGVGTIQRLEGNGEFARVAFDKDGDPKRTYGVKLSKLGKGENGTPSNTKDPSTKVDDQKPAQKVNSGSTKTRNVEKNADGEEFILGKNEAELYVGAVVIHPKFGRGKVVKLESNGKYARVVFDNDPLGIPRGIVGAKLEDASIEKETDRSGFVPKDQKK